MAHYKDPYAIIDAAFRYAEARYSTCRAYPDSHFPGGVNTHVAVQRAYRAGQLYSKRSALAKRKRRAAPNTGESR